MLEQQIDWLAKHFSVMPLDEITSHLDAELMFPRRRPAAITFDDGYSDVYHHAYPLLKRKGIPAAFFLVTGLIDTGQPQFFDRFYLLLQLLHERGLPLVLTIERALEASGAESVSLNRVPEIEEQPFIVMTAFLNAFPRRELEKAIAALERQVSFDNDLREELSPLTWDMVETLHRGGMTIGSHTKSHALLTTESAETVSNELIESKQTLETRLKVRIRHFAYPDGRFNPDVVHAVARAGYQFGYAICKSADPNRPLLTIPRKVLWERSCLNAFGTFSPAVMNCQADWAFDPEGRCSHDHFTLVSRG
jgi:peptidoglycan/xylan/chitin deacetylase (PgdA/CDA1 family)